MEETELRERLEYIAARTAPPLQDPGDLAAAVVDRHRAGRRRQWALAAVAALVLVLVPGVRLLTTPESQPAAPPEESVEIYTLPTRGSLAEDVEVLEEIRRLPWTVSGEPHAAEPRVENRSVVWADDSDAGRWALVAGVVLLSPESTVRDDSPLGVAWFIGPRGADPDQMTMQRLVYAVDRDLPVALTDYESGATVVVAAPDDRIEVSRRPEIAASGALDRIFEELPASQGVTRLVDRYYAVGEHSPVRYRVLRYGSWVTLPADNPLDPVPPVDHDITADVSWDRLRAAPPAHAGDAAYPTFIWDLVARTGVPPDQLSGTVLWAGDIASRGGGTARATVLAVHLPSGALYVGGVLGYAPGEGPFAALCGSELRAAVPVEQLVVVLTCDPEPGLDVPTDGQRLMVVAPRTAVTARALDHQGRPVATYRLSDGVAVVPVPDGVTTVEVLDAAGATLDARAPMERVDLSGD